MPLLNFEYRFADKIESGEKRQTIRAPRKYPIKAGDKLYLYYDTQLIIPKRLKLKTKFDKTDKNGKTFVVCKSVQKIIIESEFAGKENGHDAFGGNIVIDNILITDTGNDIWKNAVPLAEADGFREYKRNKRIYNLDNFYEYFYKNYGSYFEGQLIKW